MLCVSYLQFSFWLMYNLVADLAMKIRNTDLRIREPMFIQPLENECLNNKLLTTIQNSFTIAIYYKSEK